MHRRALLLAIIMFSRTTSGGRVERLLACGAFMILALSGCTDKSSPVANTETPATLDVPPPEDVKPGSKNAGEAPAAELPDFRDCRALTNAPPVKGSFRHRRSKAIAKLGRVAHSAQDVIAKPREAVTIPGKFAYGRVSKDLEDEKVLVLMDTCEAWTSPGESITDDDGRTALVLSAEKNPGPGLYQLQQGVQGDGSTVSSRLTIAPAGSRLVVIDVDGTLTVGDDELVDQMKAEYLEEVVSGNRVPEAYPDAAALTKAWRAKGYLVVYMTGRPYWLAGLTRAWLDLQGCAIGHLHTTDRNRDARPTEGGVGEFKAAYLKELLAAGYSIDYVYGNAESDVFAYADAGISPAKTHIIGEFGGQGGTQAIADGYTGHIKWVSEQPDAKQPFVRAKP